MKFLSIVFATLVLSFSIACTQKQSETKEQKPKSLQGVVYGEDSVSEVLTSQDPRFQEWSQMTAIQIRKDHLLPIDSNAFETESKTLGEFFGLCAEEKDAATNAPGDCSGLFLPPDMILTAGHCVETPADCANTYWVFNYHTSKTEIPASDVFQCREIVERKLDALTKSDFALVRLERSPSHLQNVQPVRIDVSSTAVQANDPILVLGYPGGRPLRSATGTVRSIINSVYFTGNPDTYSGNSGSPVFNLRSGKLVGVLVRGERDYIYDSVRSCMKTNVCPETGCRGEDMTRVSEVSTLTIRSSQPDVAADSVVTTVTGN